MTLPPFDPNEPWQPNFPQFPQIPVGPGAKLPRPFPPLWPIKPLPAQDPAPVEPDLRNGDVRRADPKTENVDEYLTEIARLEFIENSVDVWGDLIGRFEAQYGRYIKISSVPAAGVAKAQEPKDQGGWIIRNLYSDFQLDQSVPFIEFSSQPYDDDMDCYNIISLHSHAERILERCLSIRVSRNELASRAAVLAVEIIEFLRKDFLFRRRVANGGLSIGYVEAVRNYESDRAIALANHANTEAIGQELDEMFSDKAAEATSLEAQRAAFMSTKTAYANDSRAEQSYAWPLAPPNNATVFDHLRVSAQYSAERNFKLDKKRSERDEQSAVGGSESHKQKLVASRERAQYALQSAKLDLQQHSDAVKITKAKLDAACAAEAALNYAGQEALASAQLVDLSRDLLAVIRVMARGLDIVYDQRIPVGSKLLSAFKLEDRGSLVAGGQNLGELIIEAAVWFQSVTHFLVGKSHVERRVYKTISLRKTLGQNWPAFIAGNKQTLKVDANTFPNEGCPKLLGVGGTVIGGAPDDIIELTFELPRDGIFWRPGGQQRRFEQGGGRSVVLPRLPRQGETVASAALRSDGILGRSPIGDWSVHLTGRPIVDTIDDLHILLAVVLS